MKKSENIITVWFENSDLNEIPAFAGMTDLAGMTGLAGMMKSHETSNKMSIKNEKQ